MSHHMFYSMTTLSDIALGGRFGDLGSQKCHFQCGVNDSDYIPSLWKDTEISSGHKSHACAIITDYKSSVTLDFAGFKEGLIRNWDS